MFAIEYVSASTPEEALRIATWKVGEQLGNVYVNNIDVIPNSPNWSEWALSYSLHKSNKPTDALEKPCE